MVVNFAAKLGWLVVYNGISTFIGYFMLNPVYTYIFD